MTIQHSTTLSICNDCFFHIGTGDDTGLDLFYSPEDAEARIEAMDNGELAIREFYGPGAQLVVSEDIEEFTTSECDCCGDTCAGQRHGLDVYVSTLDRDQRHAFARGYIDCALWCGVMPDDGSAETVEACTEDLSPKALRALARDAFEFLRHESPTLRKAARTRLWRHLGHDLFLSRNGHGTGFWDRGLGDIGDALHRACQYQSRDLYMGDDGMVYAS